MQNHTPSHPALMSGDERDANNTMTRGTGAGVVDTVETIMANPLGPYWVFRACCVCVYVCVCALLGNLGHLWARLGHSKRVLELPYRTTFAPPSSWDWTTTPMGNP